MDNDKYNTKDIKEICENKLGLEFRVGKEFNAWYRIDNKKVARITVPKGRKSVPTGTYKSMAKQLKLKVKEFDDLLKCPLSADGYKKIISDYLRNLR